MRGAPVFALMLLAGAARAEAPRLEPPAPALGEEARLVVAVDPSDSLQAAPRGLGVAVLPGDSAGEYRVLPLRVGRVGLLVESADGGVDTLAWQVPRTIEHPFPERLKPLQSARPAGPNWWPTVLLLALLLLPPILWALRRMGSAPAVRPAFEMPPEPPHVLALRRLQEIRAAGWLERGELDRYYVEASHALRSYIDGRFQIPALDSTSGELLERLRRAGYERDEVEGVRPLLGEADAVKFAADRPTSHRAQEWLEQIRGWIEASAVEPVYSTPEALSEARRFNGERG